MSTQNSDIDQELDQLISQVGKITERLQNREKPQNAPNFIAAVKNLTWALEGPEICLANLAQVPVAYAAFRSGLEMGLFQNFGSGPAHVSELAKACNASPVLLARLMRVLINHGIYKYSAPETFEHTVQSMVLQNPLVVAVARGLAEQAANLTKLPDYLATISYQEPPSGKDSFFPYAMNTPLTKYEWLEEHPERLKVFQDFQSAKDEMTGEKLKDRLKVIIKDEAKKHQRIVNGDKEAETPVLFCDVGGGRGKLLKGATEEILAEGEQFKGRVVVEDLPNVVKGLGKTDLWEAIPYDFFQEQPIKGAHVYQLRDCLHNWSDESSRKILANTMSAMAPHSRVLIAETVIPETDPPLLLANMDTLMMQFGGRERTENDWKELLRSANLKLDSIEVPERGDRVGEVLIWASSAS